MGLANSPQVPGGGEARVSGSFRRTKERKIIDTGEGCHDLRN